MSAFFMRQRDPFPLPPFGRQGECFDSLPGASAAPDPRLLLPRGKSNQKRAGTKVPDLLCLGHWAEMKSIGCPVNEQSSF